MALFVSFNLHILTDINDWKSQMVAEKSFVEAITVWPTCSSVI